MGKSPGKTPTALRSSLVQSSILQPRLLLSFNEEVSDLAATEEEADDVAVAAAVVVAES